ncbi:MAG: endonuclease/exonuclease/phosphatase family protein [Pyrinomonadaceae bacterium]
MKYEARTSSDMGIQVADLNEFQKKLSLDQIYLKNRTQVSNSIEGYNKLTVLTWNIERGAKPDALAAYINQVKPDVVCLQEVDWGNQRTKNVDVLDRIARSTSMLGLFSVEFFEIQTPNRPEMLAGGGVQGNAILTRILPKRYFRIELPVAFDWINTPASKKKIVRREKRVGARFALCVEFDYFGRSIVICSTHFEDKDGGMEGRFAQFKSIAETIRKDRSEETISIIAGDFNSLENWVTSLTRTYQNSKSLRKSGKPWYTNECRWWKGCFLPETGYIDPFTCKNWTYKRSMIYKEKLDWIAVRNCQVLKQGVGDFNTSDHRPIWTQVRL